MKADVRGSTTVTDELQNKGLNPASYFSTRFFNPINKILETYGAHKVFIEGDAIISELSGIRAEPPGMVLCGESLWLLAGHAKDCWL